MKPDSTLTYLEHEPIVYFGCTWSEIKAAIFKAFMICVVLEIVLVAVPLPVSRIFTLIPVLAVWVILAGRFMRRIRALRTGKPLYYQRHARLVKNARNYIQPNDLIQVERNSKGMPC